MVHKTVPTNQAEYFRAREIAKRLGVDKKTVQNWAEREHWTSRHVANRIEYVLPPAIRRVYHLIPAIRPARRGFDFEGMSPHGRESLLIRACAILVRKFSYSNRATARTEVARFFRQQFPKLMISRRSLERWENAFDVMGLAGLTDQRQGKVGRKQFARKQAGTRTHSRAEGPGTIAARSVQSFSKNKLN